MSDHAPVEAQAQEPLFTRLIYLVLIAVMISLAQTLLTVVTIVQFVIMLMQGGTPNDRLATFGAQIGAWVAKAASFQSAASNEKPWPWAEFK